MKEVNNLPTKCILAEQGGKGGGGGSSVVLSKIEIATAPTKTTYLSGETFNTAGMVVNATYVIGSVPIATSEVTGYSVSPTTLTDGVTSVTITYSEGGVTCSATQAVTVTPKVTKIAVTTNPTTTTYEYGDTFSTSGMVVTGTYTNGSTKAVSGYTCSPTALNTVGTQTITISYTENGVNVTTSISITVNRKSVTKPTWKSNLTYTGSSQSVTATSYWNNYNTSYMTIGGTTSGTNAGTYGATFTLGSNYRWADGSTSVLTVNWTINKAAGSLSVSPTSVAIDGNNLTKTVTITRAGDGAISFTPTSVTGLTLSLSGNTLTITGNGSTAVATTTITVKVAAGTNHNAPSNATFTVSATYWEWGSETATGDATWWAGLKNWVASASASELSACVGKTKSVTLTSAVQGTTTHLVRCVGYNCDHDKSNTSKNTLTFHTANCMATTTVFGSSNGKWTGSTVRSLCTSYYNAFPGKASVATVSKGTATAINSSQAATPTYQDETVFLPSDCEMGFPKGCNYSNGKGYAASYDEFCQYNTSKTAYQYYTSNDRRIKKQGDSGSAVAYWERSLYYDNAGTACFVRNGGGPDYGYYNGGFGFAPAFVI